MALNIRKPAEKRFLKANVFAPAGAGKTTFLGSLQEDPRTSPCLGLDFEGGTESLAGLDIDVADIHNWDDFNEAYEILADPNCPYKSCFIDSISEVHKWILLTLLKEAGPTRKDPDLIEMLDYNKATVLMRRLLREFRDLPMHVVYAAHAKELEIPREGRVRVPDLSGQMAEEISGIVSVQGYLAQFQGDDGENHRTLLLHSFPKFRIKARSPWKKPVVEEIVDPTITDLLDALHFGSDEQRVAQIKARGSSAGQELDKDVDVKLDDGTALPGKESNDEKVEAKAAEAQVPSEDEVPQEDEVEELNSEEDAELDAALEAIGEEGTLDDLSLPVLRLYARRDKVSIDGLRTRRQIIDKVRQVQADRVPEPA